MFIYSEGASYYADRNSIVQMAFGATSVTLSDKNMYAFFARSCPSDSEQADILVELLYQFNLTNISVVSVSDNSYSSSMAALIIDG